MNCWRTAIRSSRPPIEFHYEDGRKRIFFAGRRDDPPGINDQLVTGIARACRWKELRDNGEFGSPETLAAALSVNGSCVRRFLRRTIMAGIYCTH